MSILNCPHIVQSKKSFKGPSDEEKHFPSLVPDMIPVAPEVAKFTGISNFYCFRRLFTSIESGEPSVSTVECFRFSSETQNGTLHTFSPPSSVKNPHGRPSKKRKVPESNDARTVQNCNQESQESAQDSIEIDAPIVPELGICGDVTTILRCSGLDIGESLLESEPAVTSIDRASKGLQEQTKEARSKRRGNK